MLRTAKTKTSDNKSVVMADLFKEVVAELAKFPIHKQIVSDLLSRILKEFIDHMNFMASSLTTAGESWESLFKDVACVKAIISDPTVDNIVDLFKRIKMHEEAKASRKNYGIGTAATGGLILAGCAAFTFFTAPVSIPAYLIAAATAGGALLPTGTGVAVDAERKIGDLATCEQYILDEVLNTLLNNKHYAKAACVGLKSILIAAQYRKTTNLIRDQIIGQCVEVIQDETCVKTLVDNLNNAHTSLIGNSSTSKAAIALQGLSSGVSAKYIQHLKAEHKHIEILQFIVDQMLSDAMKHNKPTATTLKKISDDVSKYTSNKDNAEIDLNEIKSWISDDITGISEIEPDLGSKLKDLAEAAGLKIQSKTLKRH